MRVIKATTYLINTPVWIVADKIVAVEQIALDLEGNRKTRISTLDGPIDISETPEEFLATLDKLYRS